MLFERSNGVLIMFCLEFFFCVPFHALLFLLLFLLLSFIRVSSSVLCPLLSLSSHAML
jgi:hypothetical protein